MKNTIKFLSVAFLCFLAILVWERRGWLNQQAAHYAPFLDGLDKLIGIAISVALFWLAYQANKIAKSNLELAEQEKESRKYRINADERKIFYSCYEKLSKARELVLKNGAVDGATLELYFKARNEARLQLPDKLATYAQKLFDIARKAWAINDTHLYPKKGKSLPEGDERNEKVEEHDNYIGQLLDARPDKIFARHMKIKT